MAEVVGHLANERKPPPFTVLVMHAACKSDLPPNLRHFVMTLALLANSKTGSGFYGQDAIAAALGVTDRQVRNNFDKLAELDAQGASPVRVVRKHRGTADGKGRNSDLWTLVLTGTVIPDETLTGTPVPLRPLTGTPAQLNRNYSSADRRSDRSDEDPEPVDGSGDWYAWYLTQRMMTGQDR